MLYLNIFYIISEIRLTILIPHKNSTVQQLNLSITNKCQWDKRKVTRLDFEPTNLISPVIISLLSERLRAGVCRPCVETELTATKKSATDGN